MHDENDTTDSFHSSECDIQTQTAIQVHNLQSHKLVARKKTVS
ncbi:hypothetical protein [Candidatus Nitrosotenuis uzonensis]|nr:hypothetical protein [Candidatus Nitrosotenuis uzonensis]